MIALVILGVIATFTIPKVLSSQQGNQYKAAAKEAAATVSGAYDAYKQDNTPTAATKPSDLVPYINYVRTQTTGNIANEPSSGTLPCNSTNKCYILHNGGALYLADTDSFGNTAVTNANFFHFDPDAAVSANKAVVFMLYYNGRVTTYGTVTPNTYSQSWGPLNPNSANDPAWFNWN